MFRNKNKIFILFAFFLLVLSFSVSGTAQNIKNGESSWFWRSKAGKDNLSFQFALFLKIKGKKASGALQFRNLDNGEWNGGDGEMTPFIGRVIGNVIKIEFNNEDWRNAESGEGSEFYRRPKRKARYTATLKFNKNTLEFLQADNKFISGLPLKIVMIDGETIMRSEK